MLVKTFTHFAQQEFLAFLKSVQQRPENRIFDDGVTSVAYKAIVRAPQTLTNVTSLIATTPLHFKYLEEAAYEVRVLWKNFMLFYGNTKHASYLTAKKTAHEFEGFYSALVRKLMHDVPAVPLEVHMQLCLSEWLLHPMSDRFSKQIKKLQQRLDQKITMKAFTDECITMHEEFSKKNKEGRKLTVEGELVEISFRVFRSRLDARKDYSPDTSDRVPDRDGFATFAEKSLFIKDCLFLTSDQQSLLGNFAIELGLRSQCIEETLEIDFDTCPQSVFDNLRMYQLDLLDETTIA